MQCGGKILNSSSFGICVSLNAIMGILFFIALFVSSTILGVILLIFLSASAPSLTKPLTISIIMNNLFIKFPPRCVVFFLCVCYYYFDNNTLFLFCQANFKLLDKIFLF